MCCPRNYPVTPTTLAFHFWTLWNPTKLTSSHRCKHTCFIGTSCVLQERNGNDTRFITISSRTTMKQMWQGYRWAFWKCSWQYALWKETNMPESKEERRSFVLYLSMFSIFFHILYLPSKLRSSTESPVRETVVLMNGRKLLVFWELQSQMYSWIQLEVNPSENKVWGCSSYSIVWHRVEELYWSQCINLSITVHSVDVVWLVVLCVVSMFHYNFHYIATYVPKPKSVHVCAG